MSISTHVLDTASGRPAKGLQLSLSLLEDGEWTVLSAASTNDDGRVTAFAGLELAVGTYRMRFETGPWHAAQGIEGFYPHVEVVFTIRESSQHHHVPLLISPFGYTTYRGS